MVYILLVSNAYLYIVHILKHKIFLNGSLLQDFKSCKHNFLYSETAQGSVQAQID